MGKRGGGEEHRPTEQAEAAATSRRSETGSAHARIGLLGNPSDGYAGQAIALSLYEFAAHVRVEERATGDGVELPPGPARQLLGATCARFVRESPNADLPRALRVACETTIPFQAGLAGSSALVVACLRALGQLAKQAFDPFTLAEIALAVEVEDLGIVAGPMDRVIQAYEGALRMDFRGARRPESIRRLDRDLVPALIVAWDPRGGDSSGDVHGELRARWLAGEPAVVATLREIAGLVDRGVTALEQRDAETFRGLVDRNFELRCRLLEVDARDRDVVALARSFGAAAKLCGSGGAVLIVPRRAADFEAIEAACRATGYATLRPADSPSTRARAPRAMGLAG